MFKKILLAYDGSEGSRLALEKAVYLTAQFRSELFILSVGRIPEYAETVSETEEAKEQANKYYEKILQSALEIVQERGIQAKTLIRYGKPGDEIVNTAKEIGADLIVLGTKTHPTLVRRLLGTTADKVVDNAHCSVLVVR